MSFENLEEKADLVKYFVSEIREMLDEVEPQIIAMEKDASFGRVDGEVLNTIFRLFHSLKGSASFLDLKTITSITHEAENLLDIFRRGEAFLNSRYVDLLIRTTDFIRKILDAVEKQLHDGGYENDAEQIISELRNTLSGAAAGESGDSSPGRPCEIEPEPCSSEANGVAGERLMANFVAESREILDEAERTLLALEKDPGSAELAGRAFRALHSFKGNAGFMGYGELEEVAHRAETLLEKIRDGEKNCDPVSISFLLIAVDALRDGVACLEMGGPPRVEGKNEIVEYLAKMAGEAAPQDTPSAPVTDGGLTSVQESEVPKGAPKEEPASNQQFIRVDLEKLDRSQKENKKVELVITGEETEVDKTIIEQISDPLVHLIRNAVDHGIEAPEERRRLGKPETARVNLAAKHSAGEVWIVVEDDGRGLDRSKILRRAVEKGLLPPGREESIKDEEVWRLIFEPGFSTADKVTSISGRGVGMDVVKRNIERLRGRIDIRTRPGAGTMFAIRIPLTLAIIEGMVVKVGNSRYTIPISSIKESFQPLSGQLTVAPDGQEVVRVRGELLPVVRLHELYRIPPPRFNRLEEGILIVVESDNKKCCLFVDELVGQQQIVIKGLSRYLGQVRGVSGCAILGDGDVSLILDVAGLINSLEERGQLA